MPGGMHRLGQAMIVFMGIQSRKVRAKDRKNDQQLGDVGR